jgi:hypothetical protein
MNIDCFLNCLLTTVRAMMLFPSFGGIIHHRLRQFV